MGERINDFYKKWFVAHYSSMKEEQIIKWLGDNTSGPWNIGITTIWFKEEADLLLFKLKWE